MVRQLWEGMFGPADLLFKLRQSVIAKMASVGVLLHKSPDYTISLPGFNWYLFLEGWQKKKVVSQ